MQQPSNCSHHLAPLPTPRHPCALSVDVEVVPALGANVLSLMRRDYVIMTKPGLDALVERLQRPINRLGAAGLAFRAKLQQRRAAAARQAMIEQNLRPAAVPQPQQHKATA